MSEPWIAIDDYKPGRGWPETNPRARSCCQALKRGQILFSAISRFIFQRKTANSCSRSRGPSSGCTKTSRTAPKRTRSAASRATPRPSSACIRSCATTAQVIDFAAKSLAPYAGKWTLDFSSFRPLEEERRGLPLHKRNDLLHVDAFPSRPTRGGRILRVFTNLNPTRPRVWNVMQDFETLARHYAKDAGLDKFAEESVISRTVQDLGGKLGFRGMGRTPYDMFMLRFHDYLKENAEFQANCPKVRIEFPPLATWLIYTDGVAHAAISGQFALEQTFLIPPSALVSKDQAPYRILEKIAGRPLIS